jgi:hypothetical protein
VIAFDAARRRNAVIAFGDDGMSEPSFEALRARAYELADTGRYNHWEEIGGALEREGIGRATFRLGADPVLRRMLNARCDQAKDRFGR